MKLYIARDKDGMARLYSGEPWKNEPTGTFHGAVTIMMLYEEFPEITWENSPQQVELKLINNGNQD